MSKSLEEIQAELQAANAAAGSANTLPVITAQGMGSTVNPTGYVEADPAVMAAIGQPLQAPEKSIAELLAELARVTGKPVEQLAAGLDAATNPQRDPFALPEGTKTYYSNIPNIDIIIQTGPMRVRRVSFTGDFLNTSDPAVIEHMDQIVDQPGTGFYSKGAQQIELETRTMQADLNQLATTHAAKMIAAGERLS